MIQDLNRSIVDFFLVKVLIISPTHKGIGGIAQHVRGLSNFLTTNGHHVEIMSSENTFTIPVKGLKNPSFMISSFLKSKFKKGNDIVHAHNIPAALAMKNASGKKVLTLHGIYSQQVELLHGKTTGKLSSSYEKDALSWADAITVVSKEGYEHYRKLGFEVNLVPNAIDISSLPNKEERLYKKQIIFAGRLSKEKGIYTLIELAKKLDEDTYLIIVGSGPEENSIKKLAKTKKNIDFLGYQPRERTVSLIRGSDILIQPSFVEAISSTVLEAMTCKTCVIASEIGGNRELIEDSTDGFLVDPNDSDQFLDKIEDLFSNQEKRNQFSQHSFDKVQKYDWNYVGKLYLNIYESLLNE